MGDWVCGNPLCDVGNGGERSVCRMPGCRRSAPPVRTAQAVRLFVRCCNRRWLWAARVIQRQARRRARARRALGLPTGARRRADARRPAPPHVGPGPPPGRAGRGPNPPPAPDPCGAPTRFKVLERGPAREHGEPRPAPGTASTGFSAHAARGTRQESACEEEKEVSSSIKTRTRHPEEVIPEASMSKSREEGLHAAGPAV